MVPIEDIERAREAISGLALRTPLVRLDHPESTRDIFLKLENLQPIGSFKIRGAINAFRSVSDAEIEAGVLTASAGNWAQGVAWAARERGVPCTIIVPDTAPRTKLAAIERLGARSVPVPFDRWWQCLTERRFAGIEGRFFHPVEDEPVMAGNGTIGLEILDDLPDADAVVIPWGGGGLATGIASALAQRASRIRVYGAEVDTAAPLTASLAKGEMTSVERRPSFVDGIGSERLLPKMWPFAQSLLSGAFTASTSEIATAIRLLVERNRVVAEGAGACALAVALSGQIDARRIVCIVSGGNIDTHVLTGILAG
ncbi:MAG TPA: threonine/serine dehydratase [Vicinamibacteria bacterium]|nr:threonine/serine dehydratase [Vicinamibacteria bacterium]